MTSKSDIGFVIGTCPVDGKMRFTTRKAARKFYKDKLPGTSKLSVYQCGEYFHFGHTPYLIARSQVSRSDYNRG